MAERTDLNSAFSRQGSRQGWQEQEEMPGAERSAEEIRQDIAARRESITDTVDRLSDRFQQTLDWKAYVSDHPMAALGIAAGLGFLAAGIFKPRPSASNRIKDALADGIEDLASRFHHQLKNVAPYRSGSGLGGTVKAAVAGLITKAATDYLQNKFVDRFTGQYERYPEHELEYEPEYEKRGYEKDSELFR
jgi:ElaB/YqjD/DUF883 family membrane-anchored ribosome-binding protein